MEAALWGHVLCELDNVPDNRVVGVAVHLLLEESQRRATTAADVTPLVTGPAALLSLPRPECLRHTVAGALCDRGRSGVTLKDWLPHGASTGHKPR